jgi:hypothetical protein
MKAIILTIGHQESIFYWPTTVNFLNRSRYTHELTVGFFAHFFNRWMSLQHTKDLQYLPQNLTFSQILSTTVEGGITELDGVSPKIYEFHCFHSCQQVATTTLLHSDLVRAVLPFVLSKPFCKMRVIVKSGQMSSI